MCSLLLFCILANDDMGAVFDQIKQHLALPLALQNLTDG
jgi:hypothetical protein